MRALRIVRGILGTALAFAVPWAVVGGALAAAVDALWPGASTQGPLPEFYVWVAQSGPVLFGALGGVAGALYGLLLAIAGRRWSFTQLTIGRAISLGAVGGLAVGSALFGAAGAYLGMWPVQYSIGVGIASVLGAGTASVLLAWARRSPDRAVREVASESSDPVRMAAAQSEVEHLLRDRLTTRGADNRSYSSAVDTSSSRDARS